MASSNASPHGPKRFVEPPEAARLAPVNAGQVRRCLDRDVLHNSGHLRGGTVAGPAVPAGRPLPWWLITRWTSSSRCSGSPQAGFRSSHARTSRADKSSWRPPRAIRPRRGSPPGDDAACWTWPGARLAAHWDRATVGSARRLSRCRAGLRRAPLRQGGPRAARCVARSARPRPHRLPVVRQPGRRRAERHLIEVTAEVTPGSFGRRRRGHQPGHFEAGLHDTWAQCLSELDPLIPLPPGWRLHSPDFGQDDAHSFVALGRVNLLILISPNAALTCCPSVTPHSRSIAFASSGSPWPASDASRRARMRPGSSRSDPAGRGQSAGRPDRRAGGPWPASLPPSLRRKPGGRGLRRLAVPPAPRDRTSTASRSGRARPQPPPSSGTCGAQISDTVYSAPLMPLMYGSTGASRQAGSSSSSTPTECPAELPVPVRDRRLAAPGPQPPSPATGSTTRPPSFAHASSNRWRTCAGSLR